MAAGTVKTANKSRPDGTCPLSKLHSQPVAVTTKFSRVNGPTRCLKHNFHVGRRFGQNKRPDVSRIVVGIELHNFWLVRLLRTHSAVGKSGGIQSAKGSNSGRDMHFHAALHMNRAFRRSEINAERCGNYFAIQRYQLHAPVWRFAWSARLHLNGHICQLQPAVFPPPYHCAPSGHGGQ